MEEVPDTYRTLSKSSPEILYKEKKSKFHGYAFPIQSENEVKPLLEEIKKKHPSAGHVCYAWQIGVEEIRYRANDDGEPNNSAGMPIYGQILSYEVTNVLVAVARVFGGTKLGVGGLISAYREAAKMALEASYIVERKLEVRIMLDFEYAEMDKVMRIIKQNNLKISSQKMETSCTIVITVQKSKIDKIIDIFSPLLKVRLKLTD